MIKEAPGLDVAGVAQDLEGVLAAVDRACPDIVLLHLRKLSGEDFHRLVGTVGRHTSIVVLWSHGSMLTIQDALRAKVAGFMGLDILQEDFVTVVALVVRGCAVYLLPHDQLSEVGAEHPADTAPAAAPAAISNLTSREHEILLLLAAGMTNKQIGSALHITENTVKKHVHHGMTKLSAANRVEAALLVSRYGPAV
jgi:DNA-binding NarL/FixJ family response regulator